MVARRQRAVAVALFDNHSRALAVSQDRSLFLPIAVELALFADEVLAQALPALELQLLAAKHTALPSALQTPLSALFRSLHVSYAQTHASPTMNQTASVSTTCRHPQPKATADKSVNVLRLRTTVRICTQNVKRNVQPIIMIATVPIEIGSLASTATARAEHVAFFTSGRQFGDSQIATHTQPFAPTQNCVGFTAPLADSWNDAALHCEQTSSLASQYVAFVDGK